MAGFIPDSLSQDWCTPDWIIDAVRAAFNTLQIDLDPCSNTTSLVKARVEYMLPKNDGLKDSWEYPTIFVNPPYGTSRMHRETKEFFVEPKRAKGEPSAWSKMTAAQKAEYEVTDIADWLRKCSWAAMQHGSQVIALVPVTPETEGWKQAVWPHADGVCFFEKRLKFIDFHTKKESPQVIPKPMAIIYWSGAAGYEGFERFESVFRNHGIVLPSGGTLHTLWDRSRKFKTILSEMGEALANSLEARIKTLDTRNAAVLSIEGDVAHDIDAATLARLRDGLRRSKLLPEGAAILCVPDGEINSYDADQLTPIIEKLTKLRDEVLVPAPQPTEATS
jgi:hypothetical protein